MSLEEIVQEIFSNTQALDFQEFTIRDVPNDTAVNIHHEREVA